MEGIDQGGGLGCVNRAEVRAARVDAIPVRCGSCGLGVVAEGSIGSGSGGAVLRGRGGCRQV